MTRRSALDFWEIHRYEDLFESLRLLEPIRTWEILHEIREAELEAFELEAMAETASRTREILTLAPKLAQYHDLDRVAADYARYFQTKFFDGVLLAVYAEAMMADHDFALSLCSVEGAEHLDGVESAVFLPLHMGPYPLLVTLLAGVHPVASLLEQASIPGFRHLQSSYLADLDIDLIGLPDRRVLLRCLRALREGRWLTTFPEFSMGYDRYQRTVEFLGATIDAPEGVYRLAQRTQAPLVPCMIVNDGPAHFTVTIAEPYVVGPGDQGIDTAIRRSFDFVEAAVIERPAVWQGWGFFDELVHTPHEREVLATRIARRYPEEIALAGTRGS